MDEEEQTAIGSGGGGLGQRPSAGKRTLRRSRRKRNVDFDGPSNKTVVYEIGTVFDGSTGNFGAMFDVSSNQSLIITSMAIHTNIEGLNCSVIVLGKRGTHVGFEKNASAWDVIFNSTTECMGLMTPTRIVGMDPVMLGDGDSYAFYTYMPELGIRYVIGEQLGAIFASNTHLSIHEGTGLRSYFVGEERPARPRVWNGVLEYQLLGKATDLPEGCKTETALETTYESGLKSYGNMFDVLTYNATIDISGIDFSTDSLDTVTYEIYIREGSFLEAAAFSGLNTSLSSSVSNVTETLVEPHTVTTVSTNAQIMISMGWRLIRRGVVVGVGAGSGTAVQGLVPFRIPPNSHQAFYITLTQPDIQYRDIAAELPNARLGDAIVKNKDMEIQVGVGVGTYPVSNILYQPRAWSGRFVYTSTKPCPTEPPSASLTPSVLPSLHTSQAPSSQLLSISPSFLASLLGSRSPSFLSPSMAPSSLPSLTVSEVPSVHSTSVSLVPVLVTAVPSFLPSVPPSFFASSWVLSSQPTREVPDYGNCTNNATLKTTFGGNTEAFGSMFTVASFEQPLTIVTLEVHVDGETLVEVAVYTKLGSYKGYEENSRVWRLVSSTYIQPKGLGRGTKIPVEDFKAVHMVANETRAFYVTLSSPDMLYSGTQQDVGDLLASGEYLSLGVGASVDSAAFASQAAVVEPRAFDGIVHFQHRVDCVDTGETTVVFTFDVQHHRVSTVSTVIESIDEDFYHTIEALFLVDPQLQSYGEGYDFRLLHVETKERGSAECLPAGQDWLCATIDIEAVFQHKSTLRSGDVTFEMLQHTDTIGANIDLLPSLNAIYTGEIAVDTTMIVELQGAFDRTLFAAEQTYLEDVTVDFLNRQLKQENVSVLGVHITGVALASARKLQTSIDGGSSVPWITVSTAVTGGYRPPPEMDFDAMVENAASTDNGAMYQSELMNGAGRPQTFPNIDSVETQVIAASDRFVTSESGSTGPLIWLIPTSFSATVALAVAAALLFFCYRMWKRRQRNRRRQIEQDILALDNLEPKRFSQLGKGCNMVTEKTDMDAQFLHDDPETTELRGFTLTDAIRMHDPLMDSQRTEGTCQDSSAAMVSNGSSPAGNIGSQRKGQYAFRI